jgi:hypothetical protein
MTEGLFILTTIFVAYVVYVIVSDSKAEKEKASTAEAETTTSKKATPATKVTSTPKPAASKPKPAAAKKTQETKIQPKTAAKPGADVKELRNPETGEVSTIAANYRFMKRWIKDAMVAEGLLEKVYKNNELDDAATTKINEAIDKLKTIEKYRA